MGILYPFAPRERGVMKKEGIDELNASRLLTGRRKKEEWCLIGLFEIKVS